MNPNDFKKGLNHGIPIALGYLSVSFGFGILAVNLHLPVIWAILISASNLTSAGQVAGVEVIAAQGAFTEMAFTQLIINLRYALMGFSLTQKLDQSFSIPRRMLLSFGITDEVYAVAISQTGKISSRYMAGLITLPFFGWTFGTFLGGFAGKLLPEQIVSAMGIVLYGMFIAIVLPVCRKNKAVLLVSVLAAGFRILFQIFFPNFSGGFAIVISALAASVLIAALFPARAKEDA